MKTNSELQRDVQEAIEWEPLLKAAEIGVIAKEGIITLTGIVDSYSKKTEAEEAAKKVAGVKALVENIEVKLPNSWFKTDEEIARDVLNALKSDWTVPDDKIAVKVEDGWVTLEGELSWNYQREAAKNDIKNLTGVTGISNKIKIKSEIHDEIEQKNVKRALKRSTIDDSNIEVSVSGTTVTLTGVVDSLYEKEEAGRIAWKTPGIWHVKNQLAVDYEYAL
ncbi:Osmotically-inducible protein OsmY, contains BON domain [Chryseobacterium wanjuense]|uniref:Osmotically-inducible protein OsmY, contains BON domain n=1 Tax=Chryseobacterium wanjuense TaxID=356305 RepID=A0A1I0Q8D2_9FLAO|nr:BON domain-containing protein [Chryseobacterium wanjuense]SEW23269.1 Osmotically-inducible protein OsmY, contains BON domain [Chryseobacterium wanjuense]